MSTLTERLGFDKLKERVQALFQRDTSVPIRDWSGPTGQPVRLQNFDQPLVWMVVALLALGAVMVYSASVAMPDNPKFTLYKSTHFLTLSLIHI